MTVLAAIAFATFLLENDYFVALNKRFHNLGVHFASFYGGCTDFHVAVGVQQEDFVESNGIAFLYIADVVDIQKLAGFGLELQSLDFYDSVHFVVFCALVYPLGGLRREALKQPWRYDSVLRLQNYKIFLSSASLLTSFFTVNQNISRFCVSFIIGRTLTTALNSLTFLNLRFLLILQRKLGAMENARGRFAPSPTGRMHLGNVWAALLSYLSVKAKGGTWILRHEDLDPQRSKMEYARQIEDDLLWLGLQWDEGGLDDVGPHAPYCQSRRTEHYAALFEELRRKGMLYPCHCRRADLLAASAPHASDGTPVYAGTCRPETMPKLSSPEELIGSAVRLWVRDVDVEVDDMLFGKKSFPMDSESGDFVVRRADGTYAYQLAVVADDMAMGVTEVVRGCDLLSSAARQIYLYGLLGHVAPKYGHIPLLCNEAGQRLSKRDRSLSMEELRKHYSPRQIIGRLAFMSGLSDKPEDISPQEFIPLFSWHRLSVIESLIL